MSFVRSAKNSGDAFATTIATAAFAGNPTLGNAIVGHVSWVGSGASAVTSITDNATGGSNTYTVIETWTASASNGIRMATFVAQNIKAGATPLTVTALINESVEFRRIEAAEFDTVATTGQPNAHSKSADSATFAGTTDAVTSGNGTTDTNGCTIFGIAYDTGSGTAPAAGTGYTSRDTDSLGAGDSWRSESKVQATAGAVAATFTSASGSQFGVAMVALKPSAGGTTATATPGVGAVSLAGKTPTTSVFANVRIREVLVNASGQAVGSLSNVGLRVWYSGQPIGAPDVSLNGMTTDANGTASWSIATGTLAFNQAIFYVACSSEASASIWTCARLTPNYE